MKQLQNNFTTPEQSKRLLELGVPADSADCYYTPIDTYGHPVVFYTNKQKSFIAERLPCWSVGRLLNILKIILSAESFDITVGVVTRSTNWVESIIGIIKGCKYNFSKLEE